jgi:glycosyltransferase involved in cell wall biosynthesis
MNNENCTKISILIPTYRGGKSISQLVNQLILGLDNIDLEIVIVNDCSPDNSHAQCLELHDKYPEIITYIRLSKNVGEHSAVMAGLNYVKGDNVVIIDDDFQNPPSEVKKVIRFAEQNDYDVIYTKYPQKKHSKFRNFGSWVNNITAQVLLKKPRSLYLSSFKCINKRCVDNIVRYKGPFPYIDGLILASTENIGVIQVEHSKRQDGESGYTFKKLIHLWLNMAINFSILPLRISFFLGVFLACIGVLYSINILIQRAINPNLPIGWASIITAIMVFSGAQLMMVGIIGEYVGKILLNVNQLPQFSVREMHQNTLETSRKNG